MRNKCFNPTSRSLRFDFWLEFFRRTEIPAYREKNREFRRFSRFLPKSVSKTSAKSAVCKLSSLRDRTGNQFTTTGKQFRLIRPEQGIERQIDPRSDEALVPRPSLCGAVADDYGSAVPWTKRSGGDRAAGWTVAGGRSWRSARRGEPDPGSHRSTRGESSTRLDLELLVVFGAVAPGAKGHAPGDQTEQGAACDPSRGSED